MLYPKEWILEGIFFNSTWECKCLFISIYFKQCAVTTSPYSFSLAKTYGSEIFDSLFLHYSFIINLTGKERYNGQCALAASIPALSKLKAVMFLSAEIQIEPGVPQITESLLPGSPHSMSQVGEGYKVILWIIGLYLKKKTVLLHGVS